MGSLNAEDPYKVIVNGNVVLTIPGFDRKSIIINDIPPRFQWDGNAGYCGETSMISAGLYYGQYLSQYDVRLLASNANQLAANQLLLGVNDNIAAEAMRLKYETLTSQDSRSFMKWVKHQVALGYPVIIGVLNNENLLGESKKINAGDQEYDHIVPVIGFGSDEPLTADFNITDKILISDNGLYYPGNSAIPPDDVAYYYEYEMDHFFSDREEANNPKGNMYSLIELPKYEAPTGKKSNYAIAIMGIIGQEETLPVRITTDLNYEAPAIIDGSNERPSSMALTLTVTVSDLKPNTDYNLYCYHDEKDVPVKNFNQQSKPGSLIETINITSGTSYTTTMKILSDKKVFLRVVLK